MCEAENLAKELKIALKETKEQLSNLRWLVQNRDIHLSNETINGISYALKIADEALVKANKKI